VRCARSHILHGDLDRAFDMIAGLFRKTPQIPSCHLFPVIAATDAQDFEAVDAPMRQIRELAPGSFPRSHNHAGN
jgi:hypothetical protein